MVQLSLKGDCAKRWDGCWCAALVLVLLQLVPAHGLAQFDPDNCNTTHPCCVKADTVSALIGSSTQSFCFIEYPIRVDEAFGIKLARQKNRDAFLRHKKLVEEGNCDVEACKGYVCAEAFPRCFYVDSNTQGEFRFETCRQTCEECFSTCKPTADAVSFDVAQCSGNPSQYQIACTSDGVSIERSESLMIFMMVVIGSLFLAVQ